MKTHSFPAFPRLASMLALAFLLLAFRLEGEPSAAASSAPRPSMDPWLAAAGKALEEGRTAEAAEVAKAGLAVDGRNSDLHFHLASAIVASGGTRRDAFAEFEAALAGDGFTRVDGDEALAFGAGLLVGMRRCSEALRLLEALRRSPGAEALLVKARAFLGLGDQASALAVLDGARRAYADDPRFARLFFERAAGPPTARARDLASFYIRRLPFLESRDPGLVLVALPYVPSETERRRMVEAFRASGGKGSSVQALEYGLVDASTAVAEIFGLGPDIRTRSLEALSAGLGQGPGQALLTASLARFSGKLLEDSDGDGIDDASSTYKSGQIQEWREDADQDGVFETRMLFSFGEAQSAALLRTGAAISVEWSTYPFLSRYLIAELPDFPEHGGVKRQPNEWPSRDYAILPDSLAFAPVLERPFPSPDSRFSLLAGSAEMPPMENAAAAAAASLVAGDGARSMTVAFAGGLATGAEITEAGGAKGKIEYGRGRPLREALDRDGDGRFELLLTLDPESPPMSPRPIASEEDLDGDGYFERSETLVPPLVRSWDYDADGRADALETRTADGGTRRDFSSRLDGRMDAGIVVAKDGRILSVTRDGLPLALVRDANPLLLWLGSKPFDLGLGLPAVEGEHSNQGKGYRLMRVGAAWLAELLP